MSRTDKASRRIAAPAETIYRALVNAEVLAAWLPPIGMTARIELFEPWPGGRYRMILTHEDPDETMSGKTTHDSDVVNGTFVELIPERRVVQDIDFEADDPAFAGTMRMTWSLNEAGGETEVAIVCMNVPEGIRKKDHDAGLSSTLENLASFVE